MTSKVGPKGQVVIPKAMRDELGIVPGDEVDFVCDGTTVVVEPVRSLGGLRGTFSDFALTESLEADHHAELMR